MPAARYWRVVGLQSIAGGALELSALHFYLAGNRVDASATLTCTVPPSSGAVANLQDNDATTVCRWLDVSAPGFALVWDFGAGNAQDVRALRLGGSALYAEFLETLTLQHSGDGIVWTTLAYASGLVWPGAQALQDVPTEVPPNTASLLHFDGNFTDDRGIVWSPSGGAALSGAYKKFGSHSVQFGVGTKLYAASAPSLNFATDFTIAFFVMRGPLNTLYGTIFANGITSWSAGTRYIMLSNAHSGRVSVGGFNAKTGSGSFEEVGNPLLISTTAIATDRFDHVIVRREAGVIALYLNGVKEAEATSTAPFNFGQSGALLGANLWDGANGNFTGYIDEFIALPFAAEVTVPTSPYGVALQGAALLRPRTAPASICLSGGMAGTTGTVLAPPSLQHDLQDAGAYRVHGTVHLDAIPTDLPLRRRVQLYNQRDGRLIREAWSDATTGAYSFDGIRGGDGTRYFVATFDHTQGKRAVIADGIIPEVSA